MLRAYTRDAYATTRRRQGELWLDCFTSDVKNRGVKDSQAERTKECSCDADPGPTKVRPCPRTNGRTDCASKEVTNHVHRVDSVPELGGYRVDACLIRDLAGLDPGVHQENPDHKPDQRVVCKPH